jgi:hypothetical protein
MTNVRTAKFQSKETSVNPSFLISSLGRTSIDSCKARIATRYIKNCDITNLRQDSMTWDSQGEILCEKYKYKYESEGLIFGLRNESEKNEEELVIIFHSKILKGFRYYEGISKHTIKDVYNQVNKKLKELEIGSISYHNFMLCRLTDVDIKCDYRDTKGLSLNLVAKSIIDTNSSKRILATFSKDGNSSFKTGMQLNTRASGTVASPNTKVYNKGNQINECLAKNRNSYFNSIPTANNDRQITNVYRIEITMKDKTMLKENGLPNTLGELMQVSEEQLNEVLQLNFMKWVKKEIKPIQEQEIKTGMSIEDIITLDCIKRKVYTYDSYVILIESSNASDRQIRRKKKRFVELLHIANMKTSTKLKRAKNSFKTDSNNLGNSSSDLSTFCEGIMYAAN